MPEFVACPACGCRVLVSDSMLGKRLRCISCDNRFTASSPAEAETRRVEPLPAHEPPPSERTGPPPLPPGALDDPMPPARPGALDEDAPPPPGVDLPCCPTCGRRVPWEALRCGHCGEELEIDPGYRRFRRRLGVRMRRDCEPHRGPLLAGMGNITLFAGGLTLCAAGIPLLLALPLGIATWVMANNDLAKMRTGEMEDQGRVQTEGARTNAAIGIVMALFFAAGWGLLALSRFWQ